MAKDWRVIKDDTGGPFTGWPSVVSDLEDRAILHRSGFVSEFWSGPSLKEAIEIAELVAAYMNKEMEPMTTLSQIGLSERLGRAASWIRSQGELVTAVAGNGDKETWARMEFSNHRCSGYKLVTTDRGFHDLMMQSM